MPVTIQTQIEIERAQRDAYRERMIGYITIARNSTLSDEVRLRALMQYDSACWRRRNRHALIGDDAAPGLSPRFASTIQKHDAPKKVKRPKIVPPDSLKGFLIGLLRQTDANGVGLDYGEVRAKLLEEFPTVRTRGPHHGKPTAMSIKDIVQLAADTNRGGTILPGRPRRIRAGKFGPRGRMAVVEAPDAIHTCHCLECGQGFTPIYKSYQRGRAAVYCSHGCRQAAHRNRAAAVNHAAVTL